MAWPPPVGEPSGEQAWTLGSATAPAAGYGAGSVVREILQTLLLTVVLTVAVHAVIQQRIVQGSSMAPTLHTGQRLLVSRLPAYGIDPIERGDIVIFHAWGVDRDKDFVKRVVGLPGDVVSIDGHQVRVNGQTFDVPNVIQPLQTMQPRQLGPDEYYVLGDNRGNSKDSRSIGPVPKERIVGVAWASLWPLEDLGVLSSGS